MNIDENIYKEDTEMGSFPPGNLNSNKEEVVINNKVLSPQKLELILGSEPLNEFNTEYLASLYFLHFFLTQKVTQQTLAYYAMCQKVRRSFAEKAKHSLNFGEKIDGKWVYRFDSHPRIGFWAYNILYCRRLLDQGNIF